MSEPLFDLQWMEAKELVEHPQNYRRHPQSQVREINKSLKEFGWLQNVIWNKRTGYILDGHARIEEAAKRGEKVPVRVIDVTPTQEKRIILSIGKTAEGRELDEEALAGLLSEVLEESGDLPPGWSASELEDLLEKTSPNEDEDDDEDGYEEEEILSDEPPAGIPLASIRMVQLYLTQENIDQWQEWVSRLAQHFGTTTTTDTVLATIEAAAQQFCPEEEDADGPLVESASS
jgi:ParB-like nuclease family protein